MELIMPRSFARSQVLALLVVVAGCNGNEGLTGPSDGGMTAADAGMTAADAGDGSDCKVDCWRWENPLPHGKMLTGIWGSAPTDVWVVGPSGIAHWNGTAWRSVPSGTTSGLRGI